MTRIKRLSVKAEALTPAWVAYVGPGSMWANPWGIGGQTAPLVTPTSFRFIFAHNPQEALELYKQRFTAFRQGNIISKNSLADLQGLDLACTCPLTYPDGTRFPCHADFLIEQANKLKAS